MSTRPSNPEICKKVGDALKAIEAGRCYLGVTKHLLSDFAALNIGSEDELWAILPTLLKEIRISDPITSYAGQFPPVKSYDEEMKGIELWPYRWPSTTLGKEMWLKFGMKKDRKGDWHYVHVDVHENRPK